MRPSITAVVIARDEARHLGRCLDTLAWADDRLVILDKRTTDQSASIAAGRGVKVVWQEFQTFPRQRNTALDLVTTTWILFVDADERVTPPLAQEICLAIAREGESSPVGYWIPRRNFIWGGWIQHGGWYPDHQLRLLRVDRARYDENRDVHELVRLAGPAGHLREALLHYNYDRLSQFLAKQRHYTALEAARLIREGKPVRPYAVIIQPFREFRRRFFTLAGYRDGWRGFLLAALLAWYTGLTYLKVLADQRKCPDSV